MNNYIQASPTDPAYPLLSTLELNCRRFVPMLLWYRTLLEAEIVHRDDVQCWLRTPRGWTLVLLDTQYDERPREVSGVDGLALQFETIGGLMDFCRNLRQRNVYHERALKNGLATWLVYRDPDGNRIVLRHMAPSKMSSGEPLNPLGDEFDPQELELSLASSPG